MILYINTKNRTTFFSRIDGRCSHVGALLLTLQDLKLKGMPQSQTSTLCTWNVSKAHRTAPQELDNIVVAEPKLYTGLCHSSTARFYFHVK